MKHSDTIPPIAYCDAEKAKTLWRSGESLDDAMTRAARRIYGAAGGRMYVHSEWRVRHSDEHCWEIEARVMRLVPYMRIGSIRGRLTDDDGSLPRWLGRISD